MARKVITLLEDDIDGGDAAESIEFSLDGSNYVIDLNEQNAIKLREALAPFVAAARRTSRERAGRSSRHVTQDFDPKAVRAWAAARKIEVSDRGRIPANIVEQYRAAGN